MNQVNYRKLFEAQFEVAKAWYQLAMFTGIVIVIDNIVAIFWDPWNTLLVIIAALCGLLNAFFLWRCDRVRDTAEGLLRKFEMYDSLGWAISSRELTDFLVSASPKVKKAAGSPPSDDFFASQEGNGTLRILENLEESAWWSQHLSKRMAIIVGAFAALTFIIALVTLFLVFWEPGLKSQASSMGEAVIAVIVFVFSGGYVRLALDYDNFSRQAGKIVEATLRLRQGQVTETEALNVFHDYQIERAKSPLLPDWLYKWMRDELNQLWKERQSGN